MSDEPTEGNGNGNGVKLTNKQKMFVSEYLRDFNATQAAIRAGYSERSATIIGHETLRKPNVEQAIQAAIAERAMGADELLVRLAQHARADIGDFMDIESMSFDISLQKAKELGLTHLIKKVKQRTVITSKGGEDTETTYQEIELVDQQAALALLGKHLKLFTDSLNLEVKGSINHTFEEMLRRTYGDDSGSS